jgi:hypothetical protein
MPNAVWAYQGMPAVVGPGVLTLVEHMVREGLQAGGETLRGLYTGNPKRQTARPMTERLLKAFLVLSR